MAKVRLTVVHPTETEDSPPQLVALASWQLYVKPVAATDDAWQPVGPANPIAAGETFGLRETSNVPPGKWLWGATWRDTIDQDSDKATVEGEIIAPPPPPPSRPKVGAISFEILE